MRDQPSVLLWHGSIGSCLLLLLVVLQCLTEPVKGQTSLANGQVVTRTNVQRFADLAQDVAEINRLASSGDGSSTDRLLSIFRQGMHAQNDNGSLFSLSQLGDAMASSNPKTPAFLYHLYGLTDRSTNFAFELEAQTNYINKFVEETIQTNYVYAADAIIAVSVWMYATHLMYDGVYRCHKRTLADDAATWGSMGGGGFDEFIALYIGAGQDMASTNGASLYALAHDMGETLNLNNPQAPVNRRIMLLYEQAKTALSVDGACSKAVPGTVASLWKITTQIVSLMSIPLFQGLIVQVLNGDANGAKVYAKALVPQIAKCRPSTYKRLMRNLISQGVALNPTTTPQILADLADAYSCFGYTCVSVGDYGDDDRMTCDVENEDPPFAGYDPLTDVSAVARVDLDVLQIRILATLQANDFAYFLYMHGTNVFKFGTANSDVRYVSMHDIAVSSERSNEPSFALFEDYFDQKDYADKIVTDALTGRSKWLASHQTAAVASMACAYMITFMEAISKLRIGVVDCRSATGEGVAYTLDPVDEAAALIVGSMGGHEFGGATDREDGQLMYSLANSFAFKFGTLNADQYAKVNQEIIDLLLAARAEIDVLDCDNLELSVDMLERLLTVGIIQGAVNAVIQNEALPAISTAASIAEGEILSLAVLPYFVGPTPGEAAGIEANMIWKTNVKPVKDGAADTAHAFARGLVYAIGLRCSYLGSTDALSPCNKISPEDGGFGGKSKAPGVNLAVSFASLLIAVVTGFAVWM